MPHALEAKYPRAGQSWAWHWVFPYLRLTRSSGGKPLEAKAQQGAGQDDMNNIALVFE